MGLTNEIAILNNQLLLYEGKNGLKLLIDI